MRFILHPNYVFSINDGDRHFINARDLARLYNVPYNLCQVFHARGFIPMQNDIHLHVRNDGMYTDLSDLVQFNRPDLVAKALTNITAIEEARCVSKPKANLITWSLETSRLVGKDGKLTSKVTRRSLVITLLTLTISISISVGRPLKKDESHGS